MSDYVPKFEDTEEVSEDIPSFDDTEEIVEDSDPKMSGPLAGIAKFAQGVTGGFSDEIAGGVEAAGAAVGLEGLGGDITKIGMSEEGPALLNKQRLLEAYRRGRDAERGVLEKAESDQPGVSMGADLVGGLAMPIPGAGMLKGAKALKDMSTVKKAALAAGATGAVESAGRSEADSMGELAEDVVTGTGTSALAGAGLGKLLNRFSKGRLSQKAGEMADEANLEALNSIGAKKGDFLKELQQKTSKRSGVEKAKGAGQTLIDEDIIKLKQNPIETNTAINDKLDEVFMDRIVPITKSLDKKVGQLPQEQLTEETLGLSERLLGHVQELENINALNPAGTDALVVNAKQAAENLVSKIANSNNPNKISEVLETKRKMSKLLNETDWSKSEVSGAKDYLKSMVSELKDYSENLAQKVDPQLAEALRLQNKTYGNLSDSKQIAIKELAKDSASNGLSIGDYLAGGVGGSVGGVPGTLAAVAAKKGLEKSTGKDMSQLMSTFKALRKSQQAKKLAERADNFGGKDKFLSENADTLSGRAIQAGAAITDKTQTDAPYKKDKIVSDYVSKATPEQLLSESESIRNKYGKNGEKLASMLEKVSKRDKIGRNALMFSILQDPSNRKMLGLNQEE